jgi:hypothetical protein
MPPSLPAAMTFRLPSIAGMGGNGTSMSGAGFIEWDFSYSLNRSVLM